MRTPTARGGAAGAVGVVAMDVVTWLLYRRADKTALLREKHLRSYGKDAAHALVRRVTKAAGSDAGSSEPNGAGIAVHYRLGMAPGAVYAEQRRQRPWLRSSRGTLYGLGLYVANTCSPALPRSTSPMPELRPRRPPARVPARLVSPKTVKTAFSKS